MADGNNSIVLGLDVKGHYERSDLNSICDCDCWNIRHCDITVRVILRLVSGDGPHFNLVLGGD